MWWRPNLIQYIFITLGVATTGTMIFISLMLLRSITNGPSAVNYLERSTCEVLEISYFDNLCLRDTNLDFSNLEYLPHWETCKLASFNISNSIGISCTWIFPGQFQNEQEAFIAISQNWKVGDKYECVVDTIQSFCYEDQHEELIYGLSVGGLALASCVSWSIYGFLRVKWKRRLR